MTTARYYTPSGKSIQSSGITPDIEVEFIPPKKEGEERKPKFIREKDLKGHMENDTQAKESKKPEENGKDSRIKKILEKDNQVVQAMQLLKTWNIFSQIKTGQ